MFLLTYYSCCVSLLFFLVTSSLNTPTTTNWIFILIKKYSLQISGFSFSKNSRERMTSCRNQPRDFIFHSEVINIEILFCILRRRGEFPKHWGISPGQSCPLTEFPQTKSLHRKPLSL